MKAIAVGISLILTAVAPQTPQPTPMTGSVAGRVVPEYTRLRVALARYEYDENGELKLQTVNTVPTSSDIGKFGEYRFTDVEAGEYYVYVNPAGLAAPKGAVLPVTYYPGSQDTAHASSIRVKAGDDLRLADLNIFSVPTGFVHLHLIDATGISGINKRCVSFSWKPRNEPGYERLNQSLIPCADPELTSVNLPVLSPGTYDVYAGWTAQGAFGPIQGAATSFELRSSDMDVDLVVANARITGKIVIENADGSLRPASALHLNFKPKYIGPLETAETGSDGSFRRDSIGPNIYGIEFEGLPPDAYIANLTDGKRDVIDDGLEIRSVDVHLEGMISLAGGAINGVVRNAVGDRAVHAIVALVPDLANRPSHLYRTSTTDENGTFRISGVAPGPYRLFTWSKLNGAAYKNADFMKSWAGYGTTLMIERNGRASVELATLYH